MVSGNQLYTALQFRKEKKYQEATLIYAALWPVQMDQFTEWDGWSYAYCLKELKRHSEALDICRWAYRKYPDFHAIKQLYAWCIYHQEFGSNKQNTPETAMKALEAIFYLYPADQALSPAISTAFKLIKLLSDQSTIDWAKIDSILNRLNPSALSKKPNTIAVAEPDKKVRELASEAEDWYSWKTKAMLNMGKWDQCICICNEALSVLDKFHYSNDIWFKRRKAIALAELGKRPESREILEGLYRQKREWFLLVDLAKTTDDHQQAIQYLAEAALARGPVDMKIGVFEELYTYLGKQGASGKEVLTHLVLCMAIRKAKKWALRETDLNLLKEHGYCNEEIESPEKYISQLKPVWQKLANSNEPKQVELRLGKVIRILENNLAGFIAPEDGAEVLYFLLKNFKGNPADCHRGALVSFQTISSFDKKKNRPSQVAINIRGFNDRQ